DGILLQPGQVFSFNDIVGPRTKKMGFKDAGVIVRGKIVPGIGGGICQVTSTIYNAVLMLDLNILERYNHSIYTSATSYVPIGFDAAVVWGYKDFRFVNNLSKTLLISARVAGNAIKISFFGQAPLGKSVQLFCGEKRVRKQKTIIRRSRLLKPGEEKIVKKGTDGYIVTNLMRVTMPDGKSYSKVITTDRYLTYNTLIHKGN
ncbi:VanW family protein, partial [Candidatus Riflebacteria bacterium]